MLKKLLRLVASAAGSLLIPFALLANNFAARRHRVRKKRVLLVMSQVMWDEVWQRPQEFAWRMSRKLPVLYFAPVQVHRWFFTLGRRWRVVRGYKYSQDGYEAVILSPLILPGHYKSGWIFKLNCRLMARYLRPWLRFAPEVMCLTNTPFAEPVLRHVFYKAGTRAKGLIQVTYDVIDDFPAFDWAPPFGRELEQRLFQEADAVCTGTGELLEMHKASAPKAVFIPCGVNSEEFGKLVPVPKELVDVPRPIIGYVGSISERIDTELISQIAKAFPAASVVMVGPVHLSAGETPQASNIIYLGLKPHAALPGLVQQFSVALIPFRITEATLKLNPVKTLEYLAAGVPVVSTAIPDVQHYFVPPVYVANNHQEFIEHLQTVLSKPDASRKKAGLDMAQKSSWDEMTEKIWKLMEPAIIARIPAAPPAAKKAGRRK